MTESYLSLKNEVFGKVMINRFLKKQLERFLQVILTVVMFLVVFPMSIIGQQDSISVIKKDNPTAITNADTSFVKLHDPTKATIYSMILPGLGQAYNKKYWKIPIVYAGFGVCYYFISFNNKEYNAWRDAYNHSLSDPDDVEPPVNDYEEMYGDRTDVLKDQKDYYRRNRDLTYIFTGLWYILNIVDAAVDAHLFTWEVDDKLSLKLEPGLTEPLYGYRPNGGIKLTLNFK